MPSSRRGTAANRNEAWNTGAKQNVMPTFVEDLDELGRRDVEPDAELLQDVGRSAGAGGRPVAVLDDAHAGAGDRDRRHRGDVHRARAVASGADDVDDPTFDRHRLGVAVHRVDEALHLVEGLALAAQRDGESGDLGGRGVAGEDLVHRPRRGGGVEVLPRDQRRQDVRPGRRTWLYADCRTPRARSMTVSARRSGSMGCGSAASARDQVASQASCGRPVSTSTGGAW